ncbi:MULTISPECIES: amidohydrolase [Microbacterium]|uniref:amidohydrolase n=1 Tax=Microbacterium TaxID=33882 RepID=UPI0010F67FF5
MTAVGATVGTIRGVWIAGPGAELLPFTGAADVLIEGGLIADIAPAGVLAPRGETIDVDGAWLVPGLWDHHVHVVQWALAAERVDLEGTASAAEAAARMGASAPLPDGTRVGSGFRDAFWADRPTLALIDAETGDIPTYLINADVHSVWLNSAALRREGFTADDGMLREEPAFEISRRLNAAGTERADALVLRAAQAAARRGVVGWVDLDMAWNAEAWERRTRAGFDVVRTEFGVYPPQLERAIAEGLVTGDAVDAAGLARVGSLKVITDGSLGTRTAACSHPYPGGDDRGLLTVEPEQLQEWMSRAAGAGLACAIHAIGDRANSHALDAFAATGAWGSIEHAQLVAHADIPRFARLGVTASVQPVHALDDRDLTDALWAGQTAQPYPLRALVAAGANVTFGSDAPVSPLDPWAAIAAAVYRTRGDREPWAAPERVSAQVALAASTHRGSAYPDVIAPGAVADLALVASDPLAAGERELREMPVVATLLDGRLTHLA